MTSVSKAVQTIARESGPDQPYALVRVLEGLAAPDRAAAERWVLEQWGLIGFTLQRLKEHHAWSIALGRDLRTFEPGTYAFHMLEDCAPGDGALDEELDEETPDDLEWLAAQLRDYSLEQLQEMSSQEVLEAMEDEGLDADCCPRFAQEDSMEVLIRTVMDRDLLGVSWQFQSPELPWPLTEDAFRESMANSLEPNAYAAFAAIEDPELQRQALALNGNWISMSMQTRLEEVRYCRQVLWRRRGWELVLAWDAVPMLHDTGWCIIRQRGK